MAYLPRIIILLAFAFSVAACGKNQIVLVDTDVEPVITGDNKLLIRLEDGEGVALDIRGEPIPETEKTDCPASFYEEIGSFTFVERTLAMETFNTPEDRNARRADLRIYIEEIREGLKQAFLDNLENPDLRVVNCNLVLQPDDLIYMRLRFAGPTSSNVVIECLGEGERRAQIRNPASTSQLKGKDVDPNMLDFRPDNCGVEPLQPGGSEFVDELGAVKSRCDPVRNVRINHCRIRGRTSARSLPGDLAKYSMIRADYVERLRQSAAQHVTFSGVKMEGRYKGVVHFLPGVHHFTIEDSEVLGAFLGLTIHLPADGGWNVIKNNKITGQRKQPLPLTNFGNKREVISIDASEHNRIVSNHFLDMPYGGIDLYRNCGERGDIRHRIPQYNQIINNVFDYSEGNQFAAAIFVGSRDDRSIRWSFGWGVKGYCHEDQGKNGERFTGNDVPEPWDTEIVRNSSESNSDWAQNNVVADNQVIRFVEVPPFKIGGIKLSSKAKKLDNYLIGNELVSDRSPEQALEIQRSRLAGCAVLAGVTHGMQPPYLSEVRNGNILYIRHDWTVKYFWDIRPVVRLGCGTPLVCEDNILTVNNSATCEEPIVRDFGAEAQACNAEDNVCAESSNAGDEHILDCPGGSLLGVQAACNLEFGKATDAQRDRVLLNHVKVVRASDDKDDGRCTADETRIKEGQRFVTPWLFQRYENLGTPNIIRYACKEHDKNGGDCHVNVRHYCAPLGPVE